MGLVHGVFAAPNSTNAKLSPATVASETELLVKMKSEAAGKVKGGNPQATGLPALDAVFADKKVAKFSRVATVSKKTKTTSSLLNWYVVTLAEAPRGKSPAANETKARLAELEQALKATGDVETVENNYVIQATVMPSDPFYASAGSWGQVYGDLWGMKQIKAEQAWDTTTGSASVVIADIDSGVDRTHPDIAANMWTNTAEVPGNGIDDDGNGFVDDYNGWNWVANNGDPMDDNGHGTHTAGTAAAVGDNGTGVVGVSWSSKIMALKFLDSTGRGSTANAIKALQYAADNGAKVSTNSWGCACISTALDDAIAYERDRNMTTVVAAGNDTKDALDFAPASSDGAITVAASDSNNKLASFSNFGQRIDVTAPGVDILSLKASQGTVCSTTIISGQYCRLNGTSMATPHVAGLAALVLAQNGSLSGEQVRQVLRQNALDIGDAGRDTRFGSGLINSASSVGAASVTLPTLKITTPTTRQAVSTRTLDVVGSAGGAGFLNYSIDVADSRSLTPIWQTVVSSSVPVTDGVLGTIDTTQFSDGKYTIRLNVKTVDGKTYSVEKYDVSFKNFTISILAPAQNVSLGVNQIIGTITSPNNQGIASYTIEYGAGYAPASFSTTGITLTSPGTGDITAKQLATWDTSSLTAGQIYTVRISATSGIGTKGSATFTVTPDAELAEGWPRYVPGDSCNSLCYGTPAEGDIDGDGKKEVVMAAGTNQILAFRADGSTVPGFPVTVTAGDYFKHPVNLADLDGDGKQEIIASGIAGSATARFYVLKGDGTTYPGWPTPTLLDQTAVTISDLTPSVADLNGDGKKELVTTNVVSNVHYLHAYQLNGTELAGFPKTLPITTTAMHAAPTIADLNGDGRPEIAIGNSMNFYLFDNQGNLLPGWPYTAPTYNGFTPNFQSTPAVGDIDGDGKLEITAIAAPYLKNGVQLPVYAWKMDGTLLPGWPQATGAGGMRRSNIPQYSPSVADVDHDGKDEVIVGANPLTIHGDAGIEVTGSIPGSGPVAIADMLGDGNVKLVGGVQSWGKVAQLANADGSEWWSKTLNGPNFNDSMTISDLNGDGHRNLVAAGSIVSQPGMNIYVWKFLGTVAYKADEWAMFGHDPARTNRYIMGVLPDADTVAPTVALTSPAASSTVNGTVAITATASDNKAVTRVEFYVDGQLVGATQQQPYSYSWNTTTVPNGTHTLAAKAFDASGNTATTESRTVTVNNPDIVAPTVTITSPANGATLAKNTTITVAATASDSVGVTKVEFYQAGVLKCTDTTVSYTCSMKLPAKAGTQTIEAWAYDAAGNIGKTIITITAK